MFFIISKGRPENVSRMHKHFDGSNVAYMDCGTGETDLHKEKGAKHVVEEAVFARRVTKRLRLRNRTSVCVWKCQMILSFSKSFIKMEKYENVSRGCKRDFERVRFATPISAARYIELNIVKYIHV